MVTNLVIGSDLHKVIFVEQRKVSNSKDNNMLIM